MKLQILLISGGCIALLAFAPLVHADPAKAADDCYSMAVHYTARGFAMSPTNTSGVATAGFIVKVMIPITKGLDYVILVGRDKFAKDVDLYVYDEDGQLILDDRRTDTRAGVKFRASYTGTCEAFVHMARAQGLNLPFLEVIVTVLAIGIVAAADIFLRLRARPAPAA